MVIDSTLKIWFDGELRENLRSDENRVSIALPAGKVRRARLVLNGNGGFDLPLRTESADLCINGSGDIHAGRADVLNAVINGSGDIHFDGSGTASLNINGSGGISTEDSDDTGDLTVRINGSGDVRTGSAKSLNAQINGSGDIELGEIRGGDVSFISNGSGDLCIRQGNCALFEVKLGGSGNAGAEGVTARNAKIVIENNGGVRLGRVLEESSEQIKKNGSVTILNRGAE
jgi:hypothetical protein